MIGGEARLGVESNWREFYVDGAVKEGVTDRR